MNTLGDGSRGRKIARPALDKPVKRLMMCMRPVAETRIGVAEELLK